MIEEPLLNPFEIEVKDAKNRLHKFIVSELPAVEGTEILIRGMNNLFPKAGNLEEYNKAMLGLMKYVAVEVDGQKIRLQTRDLVNNHVRGPECLLRLAIEMIRYNTSFFGTAGSSNFLDFLLQKIKASIPLNFKMQILSFLQFLQKN